jgi:3-hydroxyisobutyrate dehydrogenase
MQHIAFIGLGHMGHPMAHNLVKSGFAVHVYDVQQAATNQLAALGAIPATSIADAIKEADVIITMVQTGDQVSDLCLQANGIFNIAKPNTLYIDCSSIDITTTKSLHHEAKNHQIAMLDAPVSGGVAGALAASLTIMVGGEEKDYQRALPFLSVMGKKVIHAGTDGSGQAAKICNNLLLAISMIGVAEAFSLAEKLQLDPKKFFDISSNSSGQCWSMTNYCPYPGIIDNVPANNHYQPGFMAKMMLKDLHLGQHAAESVNAYIPLGAAATELYESFVNQGHGEMDFSAIIKLLTRR